MSLHQWFLIGIQPSPLRLQSIKLHEARKHFAYNPIANVKTLVVIPFCMIETSKLRINQPTTIRILQDMFVSKLGTERFTKQSRTYDVISSSRALLLH